MSRKKDEDIKKFENDFIKAMKPHTSLNQGDELPFGYYNPDTEGKTSWMCGPDHVGVITSVFANDDNGVKEKVVSQTFTDSNGREQPLTKEEAINIRNVLIEHGWKKIIPPEVNFKFSDEKDAKPLNRKKKRLLSKIITKMQKDNPFLEEK